MGAHDITPEFVNVNPLDIISKDGDAVREMAVITKTLEVANLALREFGVELVSDMGTIRGDLNG